MAAKLTDPDAAAAGPTLYMRLVQALRRDIAAGRFPPGARLPSEAELGQAHALSRHTVREALRLLRDEGLVAPRKGSGTVVVGARARARYVSEIGSIEQLLEYAADEPLTVSVSRTVQAGRLLARRLNCAEGQRWRLIAGLRRAADRVAPVCWTEVYLHADYADVPCTVGQATGPIYPWIEQRHGEVIAEIEQALSAHAIPARVAARLGVEPGSIGVEMRRTFRIGAGKVAQVAINLHPAEQFSYVMTLRRAQP